MREDLKVLNARDIHESRTEDAGYRRDPERNTSPLWAILSVVVDPIRAPSQVLYRDYKVAIRDTKIDKRWVKRKKASEENTLPCFAY
jgi:hypothetical protein